MAKAKHDKNDISETKPAVPNARENARAVAVADKLAARADAPSMKLKLEDGVLQVKFVHADPDLAQILMMADLGTCDPHFMTGLQHQVAAIGVHGRTIDEEASNFILSVVRGVHPRDELETMLATQMGAIHQATMMMVRRLNHVENIPQQDAAERALNKLARTFTTQIETLKRYRTGGRQTITVQHVNVSDGGQAIVGSVQHGDKAK